jgi:hypothetical protein
MTKLTLTPDDLRILADELYPHLLERLQKDGYIGDKIGDETEERQQKVRPYKKVESRKRAKVVGRLPEGIYLPEIDYLVHITRTRGEFFSARYSVGSGSLIMKNASIAAKNGAMAYYGVEAHGGNVHYVEELRHDIIIPSAALSADITEKYGVSFKQDFRVTEAKTLYLPAVMNRNRGNSATDIGSTANKSAYAINWLRGGNVGMGVKDTGVHGVSVANFLKVIENTREHWHNYQTAYERSLRIIEEADFMHLLNTMEAWARNVQNDEDYEKIGESIIDWQSEWQVVLDSAGNKVDTVRADGSYVNEDADPVNYWEKTNYLPLSPLKIRPISLKR